MNIYERKNLPSPGEIRARLRPLTVFEISRTVFSPFVFMMLFFIFWFLDFYLLSVLSVVILSFITYGSTGHDLVHENLSLPRKLNDLFLTLTELIMLRSGTTYKIVHLNHHRKYPHHDEDPEGRVSFHGAWYAILRGPIYQMQLFIWAFKHSVVRDKLKLLAELILIISIILTAFALLPEDPSLAVYCLLVYVGSWIIPYATSHLVHTPKGNGEENQTIVYRGLFYRVLAMDHLYHLEHHLYPAIAHHRWPELAQILNPHLERLGVKPRRRDSKSSLDLN